MVRIIDNFAKPFAIMKVGIVGYRKEHRFWNTSKPTIGHIIVRVAEETQKVKSSRVMNLRPFILTAGIKRPIKRLKKICNEPIDIFFSVVKSDVTDWEKGLPDPEDLKWDQNETVCKHLIVKANEKEEMFDIPDTIRVGVVKTKKEKYNALLINEMKYFDYSQRIELSFRSSDCLNISTGAPIQKSLSRQSTFGIFREKEKIEKPNDEFVLQIIAQAKLIPPYLGHVVP